MAIHTSIINTDGQTNMFAFYGEAGSGKTTAATELFGLENTLYFDCENGAKFIEGLSVWSPSDDPKDRPFKWEHFEEAAKDVVKNKFNAIAIDNFFNLAMWLEKYVCDIMSEESKDGRHYKSLGEIGFGKGEER